MKIDKTIITNLDKFYDDVITYDELSENIGDKLNFEYLFKLLEEAYRTKDNDLFEIVLWVIPNVFTESQLELLYIKYLFLENHFQHEDFILSFQVELNSNNNNVELLLLALNNIPKYLSPEDFRYPYIRKIIYAIGAQPEPYNVEGLKQLVELTDDEEIKNMALHQIKKREELGRWEAKKNAGL